MRALLLPESAGYEQNPICVYYCYDAAGELRLHRRVELRVRAGRVRDSRTMP